MSKSFVLYRLPKENHIHFINDPQAKMISSINEIKDDTFVMAPFDLGSEDSEDGIISYDLNLSEVINESTLLSLDITTNRVATANCAAKETHIKAINKMVSLIKNQKINKGVLSRIKRLRRKTENLTDVFLQLTKSYPSAFVYLALLPKGEIWCGATPETLATFKDGIFKTMALAGTQLINSRNISDIKWESKEQEEQVWVQTHISNIFKNAHIKYEKSDIYAAPAGHIAHLRNDFWAQTSKVQAHSLIPLLHPTPAVCGTPTPAARNIIKDLETHDRKYYSGFIGILGSENVQLYVNLRCMMIDRENYYLYVGGGITADSDAESEWLETENKAQTLEQVIVSQQS